MEKTELKVLLLDAIEASIEAGKEILEVYENTFEVEYKDDKSPLTIADKKAHLVIEKKLKETGIPILSEEGRQIPFEERSRWSMLWIVDPLDGTKEFIKQNGEFTVNIALAEKGVPTLGVIYVPVEDMLYFSAEGLGAFRKTKAAHSKMPESLDALIEESTKLPETQERPYTIVGSRSHMSDETVAYVEEAREKHAEVEMLSKGSSLKICMVAEGSADVYPRFAPTMEWDTAAGHAIAKEAGLEIYQAKNINHPLEYNKENLLNPWFIVKPKV
jgi:3'(2'), 5'-bisphosphate nucleotidase